MLDRLPRTLLGIAVGLVGLIAILRLIIGGFPGNPVLGAAVAAVVMASWVVYVGMRAARSNLGRRTALAASILAIGGMAVVWCGTLGAVLGLAVSFAGFMIIRHHDRPQRTPRKRLIRIEDQQGPPDA